MMDPAVSVHPIDKLQCGDVEKDVDYYDERNRSEKYRNSQPTDCFLILENT